jgi:hypothetical protein
MIIAAQPKITLTYTAETGEFTVKVTETNYVSYTLEYDWESVDSSGVKSSNTDALTNTKDSDDKNVVSDTQIAGTESSGDMYLHPVSRGVLTLSATTLDGKIVTYQNNFKITEDKKLKIISEQSSTKVASDSAVLGITTTETEAIPAKQSLAQARTTTTTTSQPTTPEPSSAGTLPVVPLIISGLGIVIIGSVVVLQLYRRSRPSAATVPAMPAVPKLTP